MEHYKIKCHNISELKVHDYFPNKRDYTNKVQDGKQLFIITQSIKQEELVVQSL
jgi:hypothetical protein